ncbi:hypothetical protein BEL04_22360 [Mucilaginibacter sp. PPCGB 2223]|uniref:hypothetical protein n=1 Tax=Mucilaginibacter sp. PPCGB 2223 TaxID=1886027 RepID=UPI00082467B3|nr:hypothetical protein [Mucilaginibacter sp. PPCGB 2223]OCX50523.1 hypothetical protein BEL04_22360 [Mucilaginibacter sp. PPCGB 2223]
MAKGHGPVNNKLADACVKNYHAIFKGAIDKKIIDAFTADVIFDKAQLIAWLNTLTTDSVKVSMGIYTPEFVAQYPTAKVNRLTTFITPYDKGSQPPSKVLGAPDPTGGDPGSGDGGGQDTFNLGELLP